MFVLSQNIISRGCVDSATVSIQHSSCTLVEHISIYTIYLNILYICKSETVNLEEVRDRRKSRVKKSI